MVPFVVLLSKGRRDLLVLQILIRGDQKVEATDFRLGDQVAIPESSPGQLIDSHNIIQPEMKA